MSRKSAKSDNVRVCCRLRPLNKMEEARPSTRESCVVYSKNDPNSLTCLVKNSISDAPEKHAFTFSEVFKEKSTQEDLYESVGRPAVEDVMKGYNATLFVYGQTGSGKTHTMFGGGKSLQEKRRQGRLTKKEGEDGEEMGEDVGSPSSLSDLDASRSPSRSTPVVEASQREWGVIPRAVEDVFRMIAEEPATTEFQVRLFFVEVYMEQVRDLLNVVPLERQGKLNLREDVNTNSFYIEGCENPYVTSAEEVLALIHKGMKRRATSATSMNETSSRSHCIMNLTVRSVNQEKHESKVGKLFMVDLAGSEKVGKTNASGMRLEEAKLINKSLTTLGLVINSLTDNSPHVPYRDSVLTKILKDSLGGNSKTSLVICCSPSMYNAAETLSTMRFGARAKNIQNSAVVNKQLTLAELHSQLALAKAEIQRLEMRLRNGGSEESPTRRHKPESDGRVDELLEERAREQLRINDLKGEIGQLQDDLNAAQETNAALVEQREEQRGTLNSLTEEIQLWEEEYKGLRQCTLARDQLIRELTTANQSKVEEIQTLINQMEEFLTPLHTACGGAEDLISRGTGLIGMTPQRRRTLLALDNSAQPLFPSRSQSQVTQSRETSESRRVLGILEEADRQRSESLDRNSLPPPPLPATTDDSPTHEGVSPRPVVTAAARGPASPQPLDIEPLRQAEEENTLSVAAAMRIGELERELEEMNSNFEEVRKEYSQCKLDLQLAEKRLSVRQERLACLKASLEHESENCADLRQTLERERERQQGQLQTARNDAHYWRRRFEELQQTTNYAQRARGNSFSHDELGSPSIPSHPQPSNTGFNLFKSILGGRKDS